MTTNVQQPINRQRPQENIIILAEDPAFREQIVFEVTSAFPVREIQFSVGYTLDSDELDLFYLSCDIPGLNGGNVVATLNNIRFEDAANHFIYSGNTSENVTSFLLREPTMLMGEHNLYFNHAATALATSVLGFIIVQITLLG